MVSSFPVVAGGPLRLVDEHRSRPLMPKEETVLTTGAKGRYRREAEKGLRDRLAAGVGVMTAATVSTAVWAWARRARAVRSAPRTRPHCRQSRSASSVTAAGAAASAPAALVEQGAKAAVAYENEYGDGLEGHKIDLYICENQSTPAGGQTCANDMVQHGVVAVVEPFTGQGQTEVPTIVGAGIPYITISGASTAELTSPGSFALEGGFPADLGPWR